MENLNLADSLAETTENNPSLNLASTPQAATCYYAGQPYSEGAIICQAGRKMRCTNNGVWSDTNQTC